MNDDGKMTVYIGNSARRQNDPDPPGPCDGGPEKNVGSGSLSATAEVHLARPLAVHMDGESCMCQQNLVVRCIPKRMRMIGS